jgi:hypothetical protein
MTNIDEVYQLRDSDDPVILSLTIGNAGVAASVVLLQGEVLDNPFVGPFFRDLGTNRTLQGKYVELVTIVARITGQGGPISPNARIIIKLTGGMTAKGWHMEDTAGENPAIFKATIGLFK